MTVVHPLSYIFPHYGEEEEERYHPALCMPSLLHIHQVSPAPSRVRLIGEMKGRCFIVKPPVYSNSCHILKK
jgi:hypothetical protein